MEWQILQNEREIGEEEDESVRYETLNILFIDNLR